jgi:glycosyltransferase involved in cell wall biosynthesis
LDDLFSAMTLLPDIPFVIAGDGPERSRLEAIARTRKGSKVKFIGTVGGDELERLIAECSFSIFPSHAYETLGKSILESAAWARPVIATDLGSRREVIAPGVTGLLYPPGNREKLAECILFLFEHPEIASRMGTEARRRLKHDHDPERHVDALEEIYSRLKRRHERNASIATPSQSKLRVAFIGGRGLVSKYSGIESYYEKVGAELARRGHEVTVYCRSYFTPDIRESGGMRILRLPTIRSKHLETLIHTLFSTVHAMFSRYDVVHYHCLGPALFSFLPRLTGKKTVVTVQGLDWQRRKWGWIASKVLRLGETASSLFPNSTMVVSQNLRRYYARRYGRETTYIPNGTVLTSRSEPKRLNQWGLTPDKYILFLGRFSPEKNCHLLIEAFEQVETDMTLVLAGGSSHTDEYFARLRRHESVKVRFLPWVAGDDLDELLSNAALFVLPSDMEGLSLALLDAMAAGVCVLTSDIPENVEVVNETGFTFERGNTIDLARLLRLLTHSPRLRREAGEKGQQRIRERYLWPDIVSAIEGVYYETLGRQGPELVRAPAGNVRPAA